MERVAMNRLSAGSVFKFGYFANLALSLPFAVLVGIVGATGGQGVYLNGQPTYGVTAFVVATILGLLFPLVPATWLLLGSLVLRLLRKRAPVLLLRSETVADREAAGD